MMKTNRQNRKSHRHKRPHLALGLACVLCVAPVLPAAVHAQINVPGQQQMPGANAPSSSPLSPNNFSQFGDMLRQSGAMQDPAVANNFNQMMNALGGLEKADYDLGKIMDSGALPTNMNQIQSQFSNALSQWNSASQELSKALEAAEQDPSSLLGNAPQALQQAQQMMQQVQNLVNNLGGQMAQALQALSPTNAANTSQPSGGISSGREIPSNCVAAFEDTEHVKKMQDFTYKNWLLSLYMMTEQLTVAMIHQASIIGAFLDAKHQLETQRILQDAEARAHADYRPSTQMCTIGTQTKSLAASAHNTTLSRLAFSSAQLNRVALGGDEASAGAGDMTARLHQYLSIYCDPDDQNGELKHICKTKDEKRSNLDVNFTRTIENTLTLDVDFTDDKLTKDEEDIFALSRNLYAHSLLDAIPADLMLQGPDAHVSAAAWIYMNARSLFAMRSVAQNSYAHLVGMRAKGGTEVYDFMIPLFEELGISREDAEKLLGKDEEYDGKNPSYFAQMDVLTKKLYQRPEFYTNLYDSPENVKRTGVALQAIGLMQDRDRYESALRREMLLSLIVELHLRKHERTIDAEIISTAPVVRINR